MLTEHVAQRVCISGTFETGHAVFMNRCPVQHLYVLYTVEGGKERFAVVRNFWVLGTRGRTEKSHSREATVAQFISRRGTRASLA